MKQSLGVAKAFCPSLLPRQAQRTPPVVVWYGTKEDKLSTCAAWGMKSRDRMAIPPQHSSSSTCQVTSAVRKISYIHQMTSTKVNKALRTHIYTPTFVPRLIGGVVLGGLAGYSFASYLHQCTTKKDDRLHINACNEHRRL